MQLIQAAKTFLIKGNQCKGTGKEVQRKNQDRSEKAGLSLLWFHIKV
ncbi:Hypothetical protein Minf_2144 [Methylacidiphilum infernorum V4]|uniref:Uncharacterized protein n=1 Tax=Methylacidiphilum infernorum (isolate V4) TaxID=481448 RepID=B3DZL3_METI4|nr:Hypothetical protein Minf_2144 [Methylacidiphilum infernorum V4]